MAEKQEDQRETIEVVKRNWRAEAETAQVYRELAEREVDEKRKGILLRMAEAEERHARRWEEKLTDLGEPVPVIPDSLGRRFKHWLNRALGTEIAIRRMEAAEEKHEAEYQWMLQHNSLRKPTKGSSEPFRLRVLPRDTAP